MTNKVVHIVGGGSVNHIHAHFSISAPAYGGTARRLETLCKERLGSTMDVMLHLTKMADHKSTIETHLDLQVLALNIVDNPASKIVFWNPAVVDWNGRIENGPYGHLGKGFLGILDQDPTEFRLSTSKDGKPTEYMMRLRPSSKIAPVFRQGGFGREARKDIFLVAFKATASATPEEMYRAGLDMLKRSSANLVLANDVVTKLNMIIVPEEATYSVTTDREKALRELVEMAYLRSHLTFTRSTVVAGEPVAWESPEVPANLRAVVDYCIRRGAYQKVRGVTAGHFAVKLDEQTFLTSRRKTDFNDMKHVGLVKVRTDGPDSVIAYGSKPSVGGQSQRIVFAEHQDADCIVHFHCEKKAGSQVPTISQREYECGSHECGRNTSRGLARFGNLEAIYLDNHGPNIVFSKTVDPQEVIDFIVANFDLDTKTGGYAVG